MTVTTQAETSPVARLRTLTRTSGPWTRDAILLVVVTGLLLLTGLVMTLSASFVADAETGDAFATFVSQFQFAVLGCVLFLAAARVHHEVWRPVSWTLLSVCLFLLVLVLVPGVGLTRNGSTSWLALGPVSLQPSEFAKLATLLWLVDVTTRKREARAARTGCLPRDVVLPTQHLLVPALPLLGVLTLLLMLQPDLGTTLLTALVVFLVLWFEGLPLRMFGLAALAGVVAIVPMVVFEGYRMRRILGWWDPEADPLGAGWQLLQSMYALGNGGWLGTGLGASRGKWKYIPNPETDFIYAIVGEELGLVGALAVLGLFVALLVIGMRIAARARTRYAQIVAAGVTAWVVGSALLNIGTVTGLLPITGVTLPLVSVGGSSLVSTLVALGILCSIARSNGVEAVE